MNSKAPHLVQYQGSKRNLASSIVKYLPLRFERLIEPFSGTAAISLFCASQNRAEKYLINDANQSLIDLLKLVVNDPLYVYEKYQKIWNEQHVNSVQHYFETRDEFNNNSDPVFFLYLLARCVKGAVRYNSSGMFNQSVDKRRKGTNPLRMKENILGISNLLKGRSEFSSLDYKDLLKQVKAGDIVYMDPPYQGVCGDRDPRYFTGITTEEFISELYELKLKGIEYIISYDGRCGNKKYGQDLPKGLGLEHIYIEAGRSSQATLLGRKDVTVESLYVSEGLFHNSGLKSVLIDHELAQYTA